jgi:cell division septum initiation protein DivIVA
MTAYVESDSGWTTRAAPRSVTPDQLRRPALGRTPLGRRGYDENHVHALLNRVATELESVLSERAALRGENARLKEAMRQWHTRHAANPAAQLATESRESAVQVLSRAQREADQVVADAQNYARSMVEHARDQYDAILREAYGQAQMAAEMAARNYRTEAGDEYRADLEELQRHVAWAQTFVAAIDGAEKLIRSARVGLSHELRRIEGVHQEELT